MSEDFQAALIAWWLADVALTNAMRGPYLGQAPLDVYPPLAVIKTPTTRVLPGRGSLGTYQVSSTYEFQVYHPDLDVARDLGKFLKAKLDTVQDERPTFADGYLMSWLWQGEMSLEVPEQRSAGARTVWQQSHTYVATIGGIRRRPA